MAKKRADGYYQKQFRYEGKKYTIYAKNPSELFEKEKAKKEELQKIKEVRENPTIREYFEKWESRRMGNVSEASIRGQRIQFNASGKVFIPEAKCKFADLKVREITIDDLLVVQRTLAEKRVSRGVNDVMATIKQIMNSAKEDRIIDYNPCVRIKPLKRTEPQARNTIHRALSISEQTAFFNAEATQNSFYYDVFRIAILTGMRIGEIGALKNSDIHDGFIHIERTITRTELGGYKVGDRAKTDAGKRKIPMNDKIKAVIAHQRKINKMLDNDLVSFDDLIFKAPERGLLKPYPVDREIKRICKMLDIEPITSHGFRDTFATRAIENGIAPKTLQEILGHSDISMTLNLYAHCLDDTKKEAMNQLDIAIPI